LKLDKVVVAGNSLGGEVAWRVASLSPQRVDRLILVDASGYDFMPDDMPVGFRIARLPVISRLSDYFLPRGLVEASVQNVYGDPARVSSALIDRYFELTLREGNRRALRLRMQQLDAGVDVARIAQLKLPTLILWGAKDRLIPPPNAQRFAHDIAGSQLTVFPELGHVPMEEDPARTSGVVRHFLGLRSP
jgi:pimeloyl-ACP methyl ester carboxylesterase